jgi:superfamily II DNA or RNA helicase
MQIKKYQTIPNLTLREYQQEVINNIIKSHKGGFNRQLIHMATGTGKTIVFSALPFLLGLKTLVLVNRDELVRQTVNKCNLVGGGNHIGIIQRKVASLNHQVVVASVQTLLSNGRLYQLFPKGLAEAGFGLLVTDECHHARAEGYEAIYTWFGLDEPNKSRLLHLGFTATPMRTDGKGLGLWFDVVAYSLALPKAIKDKHLTPLLGYKLLFENDEVESWEVDTTGDYASSYLDRLANRPVRDKAIVTAWREEGLNRPTIAFCASVEHAKRLADEFNNLPKLLSDCQKLSKNKLKPKRVAAAMWGNMPVKERVQLLAEYKRGEVLILTNCSLFTEGFDAPHTACVILARPTSSELTYLQMIGRGTRLYPGKENCLIIDVRDVSAGMSLDASVDLEDMLKEQREWETNKAQRDMSDEEESTDTSELDAIGGINFEILYEEQPMHFEKKPLSRLNWCISRRGNLVAQLQIRQTELKGEVVYGCCVIHRRGDFLFDVLEVIRTKENGKYYDSQRFLNAYGLGTTEAAIEFAEEYMGNNSTVLKPFLRNSYWNKELPTNSQLRMINWLSRGRKIAKPSTKLEASEVIEQLLADTIQIQLSVPDGIARLNSYQAFPTIL